MISVTDRQNHTERKAPWPDLIPASLGDLPSTRLRKGEKNLPPGLNHQHWHVFCYTRPPQGHSSAAQTFSDPQTIFVIRKNLEFKIISLRNTQDVLCFLISLYPTSKSSDQSSPNIPSSVTYTLWYTSYCLSYWVTITLPIAEHRLSHAPHRLDLWKGGCFSVLVTITLCFKLQLIFPCPELQFAKVP